MADDYAERLKAERARKNAERQARTDTKIAEIERKQVERAAYHQQAIDDIKARRNTHREEQQWDRAQRSAIAAETPAATPEQPDTAELEKASKQAAKEAKKAAKAERRAEKNAEHQAHLQAQQAEDDRLKARYGGIWAAFTGKNGSITLKNGYVKIGLGLVTKVPVENVAVSFEDGGRTKRMTATRVIAGGALLGPLGAAAGAALRKDKAGAWIFVCDGRSGHVEQVAVMPKEVGQAMKLVAQVEAAQNLA